MIQITCKGNSANCTHLEKVTSGMVGAKCQFAFDNVWEQLTRVAVFRAGNEHRSVLLSSDTCIIPWEVLQEPGYELCIGVYGEEADGTLVIPTIYVNCGRIQQGAVPSNDPNAEPTSGVVQHVVDTVTKELEGRIGNGDNLVNTYDPVAVSDNSTPTKEGDTILLTNVTRADSYFYLNLTAPLCAGEQYTLSFDATGVEENKAPTYAVRQKKWGSFTIKNGHNVVPFIPSETYTGSRLLIDDLDSLDNQPSHIHVKLFNFKIERGGIGTPYSLSLIAMDDKLRNIDRKTEMTRSYRDKTSDWYCLLTSGNFYLAVLPVVYNNLAADNSFNIGNGATVSQERYLIPPYPTKATSFFGNCDRAGQYISFANGYVANGASVGLRYRIVDPQGRDTFSSSVRLLSAGEIAVPPSAPGIAYNASGAAQAVAIAQSYVDAQLSGREFRYGRNIFYSGENTVNDENGAAMMECDTYIGMILRGIPYQQSPFAITTPNYTCSYSSMMENTNPNGHAWCNHIMEKMEDQKYLRRDVKYAADLAWMCWGMEGSVFTDISCARSGDLVFWKRQKSCDYFDNIGHVALLSIENGVPYVYEVSDSNEGSHTVLHKIKLSDKSEQPTYFGRINYANS